MFNIFKQEKVRISSFTFNFNIEPVDVNCPVGIMKILSQIPT